MTGELLGRIVLSKAGRDKGRRFVVVAIEDAAHVRIADGGLRKIARAKKKKLKHLSFERTYVKDLESMLAATGNTADAALRKALALDHETGENKEG